MPWKESDAVTLREEFVLKALGASTPFGALCDEYGISRKTGYKWMERFHHAGLPGLRNESRRPLKSTNALSEDMVCELVRIKRSVREGWGPKKVLALYERRHGASGSPSLSSVKRVLERAGFVERRRRRRETNPVRIQEGVVPTTPNQQWTVDFKGWWKTRDGRRCDPLTVRDGYSRFLLDLRAMDNQTERGVRYAFERIFEQYGLPNSIRSDNGSPFASNASPLGLTRLSSWWVSLGVRLDRIDPGRPDQNGAHERIHRDIRSELQLTPAEGAEASQAVFDEWRHEFNWKRPHEALGMRMPGEVYSKSARVYDQSPVDVAYPPDWLERRVSSSGTIRLAGHCICVSTALGGHVVGLQPVADRLDVWFDHLRLGCLDLCCMKFLPISRERKRRRPFPGRHDAPGRDAAPCAIPVETVQTTTKVLPMS